MVGFLTALIVGVLVAFATSYFTSRFYVHQATTDLQKDFERRFNDHRWSAYTEFSNIVMEFMQSTNNGSHQKQQSKFVRDLQRFIGRLWLAGSDEVVRAVLKWRRIPTDRPKSGAGTEILVALAEILIAMRRDLGYVETAVSAKDILGTFITDIDKYIEDDGTIKQPLSG